MSGVRIALLSAPLALVACAPAAQPEPDLYERLEAYCGQAFEGRVTSDDARDADFASERLVMHVRECGETQMRIPFHVGEDRSRTWIVTRLGEDRLRLKHDHRHADGVEDELSRYGGDSLEPGTPTRQTFPADAYSIDLFTRTGRAVSNSNVWALEADQ